MSAGHERSTLPGWSKKDRDKDYRKSNETILLLKKEIKKKKAELKKKREEEKKSGS